MPWQPTPIELDAVAVDLTLDVQVFMSGAGTGAEEHQTQSRQLMDEMRDEATVLLVLDKDGWLIRMYERGSGQGFGKQWLIAMLSRKKVKRVARVGLEKSVRVAFDEEGFRGEDRDRVARTAAGSNSGRLVAHEAHFHAKNVKKLLKKHLDVVVVTADGACAYIERECRE